MRATDTEATGERGATPATACGWTTDSGATCGTGSGGAGDAAGGNQSKARACTVALVAPAGSVRFALHCTVLLTRTASTLLAHTILRLELV